MNGEWRIANSERRNLRRSHRLRRRCAIGSIIILAAGCTSTSNKLAVRGSERSDGVTSAIIERQHKSLCLLLYRETLAKLEGETDPHQQAAIIQDAFNDRDLFEFWYVQAALARCLHYGTVDAYLASQKSMFDLIAQDIAKRSEAPLRKIEGYAAARLGEALASPPATQKAAGVEPVN